MAEKKKDGRRNNGAIKGISRGQGRPRKIADKDMNRLTLSALKKIFGSEEKMWIEVAKLARLEDSLITFKTNRCLGDDGFRHQQKK